MMTDDPGQKLHDRATRGETLSPEDRVRLDEWYARLDREESEMLARNAPPPQTTVLLQAQIEAALAQILTTTQRIQSLMTENEALRQEIAALQRRLAQKRLPQSA